MNEPNSRDNIKDYFITGAIPTQEQFEELLDAFVHRHHESEARVGLGTSAPMNILDVDGSVAIGHAYAGNREAPDNGLLVDGKVGIGTGDPLAELHVNGAAIIDGGGLTIGEIEVINAAGEWHDPAALQGPQGDPGQNGQDGQDGAPGAPGADGKDGEPGTSLWSDGVEEVTTDVNVGIQTKTPETALHVNGFVTKQQVAFTLNGMEKVESNFQIKFNAPETNEGGGWQEGTNEFIAPENGTYLFLSNIIIREAGQGGELRLIKNHELQSPLFLLWEQLIAQGSMSNSLAVPLQKGESITVFANQTISDKNVAQFNLTGYRL